MSLFKPKLFRVRPTFQGLPVASWRNVSWGGDVVWKRATFKANGYLIEFRPRYASPFKVFQRRTSFPESTVYNGTFSMLYPASGWLYDPKEGEE